MKNIACSLRQFVYRIVGNLDRLLGIKEPLIVVYCYHSISSDGWRYSVTKNNFDKQIRYLLKNRQNISLADLSKYLNGSKKIDRPSFVLTFDDGYQSQVDIADYLVKQNITPCLFVLSDPDNRNFKELGNNSRLATVEELKKVLKRGWEIGSHSATHSDFAKLTHSQAKREVLGSKSTLTKSLSFPIRYFALPRGKRNNNVDVCLKETKYELCLTMDDGFIKPTTDRYAIPRIGVDGTHIMEEFRFLCSTTVIKLRRFLKSIQISKLYE